MSAKGARYERMLVGEYQEAGYFARRAAASGSGSVNDSYDVIAAKDGTVHVDELKYADDSRVYIAEEKVDGDPETNQHGLRWIASMFGGAPLLVARFKGDTQFYATTPHECERTPSGNYVINREQTETMLHVP